MPEQPKLGNMLQGWESRDAVHVAISPVMAGGPIKPGEWLEFAPRSKEIVVKALGTHEAIGIADPFLGGDISEGNRFYMLLRPGTISSLCHVWIHPLLDRPTKLDSEAWLRKFCDNNDCPDFDIVLAAITGKEVANVGPEKYLKPYQQEEYGGERYLKFNGRNAHCVVPDEFWRHMEGYLEREVPNGDRVEHFTCTC